MEFKESLQFYMKKNGMKQADLCRLTSIPSSLMSWYVTGKKTPSLKNAILIAKALNVSLELMISRTEKSRKRALELTSHEEKIIKKYRSLDERGQKTVDLTIEAQSALTKSEEKEAGKPKKGKRHD